MEPAAPPELLRLPVRLLLIAASLPRCRQIPRRGEGRSVRVTAQLPGERGTLSGEDGDQEDDHEDMDEPAAHGARVAHA